MRLLALVPPGTNARSIYCDMLRGVQRAGHQVFFEDIAAFVAAYQRATATTGGDAGVAAQQTGTLYARHLESLARTLACDAMITLGVDGLMAMPWVAEAGTGRPTSFVELIRLPVVHYWLDAPFWAYGGRLLPALDRARFTSRFHVHVVNNDGTADEMRRVLGFQTVVSQPYGVDEATFRPWAGQTRDFELAICCGPGDPAPTREMREELAQDEPDVQRIRKAEAASVRGALVDAMSAAGSARETTTALADSWLAEQLSDPDRPMLNKLDAAAAAVPAPGRADAARLAARLASEPGSAERWASITAMIRRVDSWQRAFTTTYLSQHFRSLWLGSGAAALEQSGWPIRGDRTGFLEYHEMSVAYGRASAAVSVMRYQDDIGLNPKGLEIAASGTAASQRGRVGAAQQLDAGTEGLWFRTPTEAREQLRTLLGSPNRDRVAAAGLSRVLRDHSWRVKGGELIRQVGAALQVGGVTR